MLQVEGSEQSSSVKQVFPSILSKALGAIMKKTQARSSGSPRSPGVWEGLAAPLPRSDPPIVEAFSDLTQARSMQRLQLGPWDLWAPGTMADVPYARVLKNQG